MQIEAHIVSVEAVTKKDATDIGWLDDDKQRAMIKVTLATPANLRDLAGKPGIHFGARLPFAAMARATIGYHAAFNGLRISEGTLREAIKALK
jgi:hypothetical protein